MMSSSNGHSIDQSAQAANVVPKEQFFKSQPEVSSYKDNGSFNLPLSKPESHPQESPIVNTYVQQSSVERFDTFVTDKTRIHWNRGFRYGYALLGNQDLFDSLLSAHVAEFQSIVSKLIEDTKMEIEEVEFMIVNGTELLRKRFEPRLISLIEYRDQLNIELELSSEHDGKIHHSTQQFTTGWKRGLFQYSDDYMKKRVNTSLIEETKGEIYS